MPFRDNHDDIRHQYGNWQSESTNIKRHLPQPTEVLAAIFYFIHGYTSVNAHHTNLTTSYLHALRALYDEYAFSAS